MRVLVTGSRKWRDWQMVYAALNEVYVAWLPTRDDNEGFIVVHGGAVGADSYADEWARAGRPHVVPEEHKANWELLGHHAGEERNGRMVERGADLCLAFPTGVAKGTRNCMKLARRAGIDVRVFRGAQAQRMKTILVIAAGCAATALFGAPSAQADINISGINIGNQGNAEASFGNVAVALGPLDHVDAVGGVGNIALASGGSVASKQGPGSFNVLTAAGHSGSFVAASNFNWVSTLNEGTSHVVNSNGTFNVAIGRSDSKPSTSQAIDANLSVQTSFCGGTALSAQGRINVSAPCIGG